MRTRIEPTRPASVVYMATAMPSLIRPIEDFMATLSAASRPAIGDSMIMKPMIVPSKPSFIRVSETNAPKPCRDLSGLGRTLVCNRSAFRKHRQHRTQLSLCHLKRLDDYHDNDT